MQQVKKWITNGGDSDRQTRRALPGLAATRADSSLLSDPVYSDYFTTAVRTAGRAGDANGISILLIPNGPGVTRRRMHMSGQHCAGTTYLSFEDVRVPVSNLIGREHAGFRHLMTNFNHERLMICYVGHRLARICIEDAFQHAMRRVVFGKKLIESEVIRSKLAQMSREVEAQQAWIEVRPSRPGFSKSRHG